MLEFLEKISADWPAVVAGTALSLLAMCLAGYWIIREQRQLAVPPADAARPDLENPPAAKP